LLLFNDAKYASYLMHHELKIVIVLTDTALLHLFAPLFSIAQFRFVARVSFKGFEHRNLLTSILCSCILCCILCGSLNSCYRFLKSFVKGYRYKILTSERQLTYINFYFFFLFFFLKINEEQKYINQFNRLRQCNKSQKISGNTAL
jgi:hypothetical protein